MKKHVIILAGAEGHAQINRAFAEHIATSGHKLIITGTPDTTNGQDVKTDRRLSSSLSYFTQQHILHHNQEEFDTSVVYPKPRSKYHK